MSGAMLVLLDGLGARAGRECMSCLEALRRERVLAYGEMETVLPPLSKPVYATLMTGLPPAAHGVARNEDRLPPGAPTLFSRLRDAGIATAAAAHAWFAELCNGDDYDPADGRLVYDPLLPVSRGLFYKSDAYPDAELFEDAEVMLRLFEPGFMLVHSMGIDCAGHAFGGESREYRRAARAADALLGARLPRWLAEGRDILIMADHGMDAGGDHYDQREEVLRVPVWGSGFFGARTPASPVGVAPLIARYFGLDWA